MSRYFCGAVLVGPHVRASRRWLKMPWKMAESMIVEGMVVLLIGRGVQERARARVRWACSTTGRSTMRPSSRAAPGAAASAASTRRAHVDGLGVGASAAWIGCDLARVDAQLGAEAVPARPRQVGQQPGLVVELGGDAGDRRGQPGDAGGDGQPARRVAQPVRRLLDVQVEVQREVQRAENQPRPPRRPPRSRRRPARPRARFRSAASTSHRAAAARTAATCSAVSALGSITAGSPASASRPQVAAYYGDVGRR